MLERSDILCATSVHDNHGVRYSTSQSEARDEMTEIIYIPIHLNTELKVSYHKVSQDDTIMIS
jgi:hypothetical protein